jgi:Fe2+ transport system protein B
MVTMLQKQVDEVQETLNNRLKNINSQHSRDDAIAALTNAIDQQKEQNFEDQKRWNRTINEFQQQIDDMGKTNSDAIDRLCEEKAKLIVLLGQAEHAAATQAAKAERERAQVFFFFFFFLEFWNLFAVFAFSWNLCSRFFFFFSVFFFFPNFFRPNPPSHASMK